jgi:transcriptional regulator with XRE-family HTH domain
VSLAKSIRDEIERRGMPLKRVSDDTGISYSTLRDFVAAGAGISIDRASELAAYLGLELTVSKLRKQEMKEYEKMIQKLEAAGHDVDQDSIEAVAGMVENLKWLKANGGWEEFGPDEAKMVEEMVANLQWLADHNWEEFGEDDATMAADFVANLHAAANLGWESFDADDAVSLQQVVDNLQWLDERGEEASAERIEEVAQLRANLESLDQ